MSGIGGAFRLLTRIPLGGPRPDRSLVGVAGWFPVVGLVVGLAVGGVYALFYPWMPSVLSAVIAVGGGMVLTGALHEDGLADTMDAFAAGASGQRALEIMRDSRLGTYGTLALVVSILWRVGALGSLPPSAAVAAAVVAHALGRTAAVGLMAASPAAREDGLGSLGVQGVDLPQSVAAIVAGIGLTLITIGALLTAGVLALALTVVLVIRTISRRRIGGVTGDVLGASEQFVEMGCFAVVAAAVWTGWAPWWL